MAKNLTVSPMVGTFDVNAIEAYLDGCQDVFRDPLGTGKYLMCGVPEAVSYLREKRLKDPSRFPYVCLIQVEPEYVHMFQEMSDAEKLRSARAFLSWLCEHFDCRIQDEYGRDLTELYRTEGIDAFYPPGL